MLVDDVNIVKIYSQVRCISKGKLVKHVPNLKIGNKHEVKGKNIQRIQIRTYFINIIDYKVTGFK